MYLNPRLRRVASITLLFSGTALASTSAHATGESSSLLPDAPSASTAALFQTQSAPQPAPSSGPSAAAQQQTPPPSAPDEPQSKDKNYTLQSAEHQRILGVMPEFNAVNNGQTLPPLTPKEKFHLMWKSSTDPYIFTLDAIVAGIGQAKDSNPGFGQGAEGYFKRFGASYADTFDGNFWGNAVLTIAFKEDPRYYRKGTGSIMSRALYSAKTAVWTHNDNGTRGPNYGNILGNFISGGISNAYYPASDRGLGKTVTGALTVTAEGSIGSELEEFWPDIAGHYLKKRRQKLAEKQAADDNAAARAATTHQN